jgi:hypothetical protein
MMGGEEARAREKNARTLVNAREFLTGIGKRRGEEEEQILTDLIFEDVKSVSDSRFKR